MRSNFLSCLFHLVNCDQMYYDKRLFISLYEKGQDYCYKYISYEIHTRNGGNARINLKLNLIFSQLNDWHWYGIAWVFNGIELIQLNINFMRNNLFLIPLHLQLKPNCSFVMCAPWCIWIEANWNKMRNLWDKNVTQFVHIRWYCVETRMNYSIIVRRFQSNRYQQTWTWTMQ